MWAWRIHGKEPVRGNIDNDHVFTILWTQPLRENDKAQDYYPGMKNYWISIRQMQPLSGQIYQFYDAYQLILAACESVLLQFICQPIFCMAIKAL